jgi:hypothetical protein
VQVQGGRPGGVVGHHRLVHVHRALRRARGAAGEVQHRHVLRVGGRDLEGRPRSAQQVAHCQTTIDALGVTVAD